MALINVEDLSLNIGQKKVLINVHLTVQKGEIVTLIGPNGAGKSTLVRTILGLIKPTSGKIQLKEGIKIGYMPQRLMIEPYMPLSVERFLQLAHGFERSDFKPVIEEFNIAHIQSQSINSLSGGELQRVLLARTQLRRPELLVLDEPVQGVDISGQEELYRLIKEIRDKHSCGILMISHDLHLVMAGTDSVVCLNKHVCCSGHPESVSNHPEFLNLFGVQQPAGLTLYEHRHTHRHTLEGEICP